uniref:Uncharacterized protein n=1 Tax=Cacopsylla melanoneura TaxID=428564 RepID=A0A8D8VYC5_9HEMI
MNQTGRMVSQLTTMTLSVSIRPSCIQARRELPSSLLSRHHLTLVTPTIHLPDKMMTEPPRLLLFRLNPRKRAAQNPFLLDLLQTSNSRTTSHLPSLNRYDTRRVQNRSLRLLLRVLYQFVGHNRFLTGFFMNLLCHCVGPKYRLQRQSLLHRQLVAYHRFAKEDPVQDTFPVPKNF